MRDVSKFLAVIISYTSAILTFSIDLLFNCTRFISSTGSNPCELVYVEFLKSIYDLRKSAISLSFVFGLIFLSKRE